MLDTTHVSQARLALSFAAALGLLSCNRPQPPSVELELSGQRFRFVPRTAFAEYFELPGAGDQLRVTLASYEASCENYRGPAEGEVLLTLTLRAPPGKNLSLGSFPWKGLDAAAPHATEPGVVPFVRLARGGRTLAPGGGLELVHFDKGPHGLIEGHFAFSTARAPEGENEPGPETSSGLRGGFSVRLCRVSLEASRTAP